MKPTNRLFSMALVAAILLFAITAFAESPPVPKGQIDKVTISQTAESPNPGIAEFAKTQIAEFANYENPQIAESPNPQKTDIAEQLIYANAAKQRPWPPSYRPDKISGW